MKAQGTKDTNPHFVRTPCQWGKFLLAQLFPIRRFFSPAHLLSGSRAGMEYPLGSPHGSSLPPALLAAPAFEFASSCLQQTNKKKNQKNQPSTKPQTPLQSPAHGQRDYSQSVDCSSSQTCCPGKILSQIPPWLEGTVQPPTSCRVPARKPASQSCQGAPAGPELSPNPANALLQGTKQLQLSAKLRQRHWGDCPKEKMENRSLQNYPTKNHKL